MNERRDTPKSSSAIRSDYLPFGRPNFSDAEAEAVLAVMRSGWVGMGPETQAFEEELAQFVGAPHVVTVNSCTSAMFLSLLVHGVGAGNEVICPSLTWCSTANVALYLGAKPVFCDVDPETLCVRPDLVREKLSERTRAVMVVHLGGYAVDVEAVRRVLPDNVVIIEDAAHAFGAMYASGKRVGSSGNLVCFSFYANKNLSTAEGGAVALFDESLAGELRSLRQHGLEVDAWKRFTHSKTPLPSTLTRLGYKMNFTDLQAAIGRVQLRRQEEFHAIRLAIARRYAERLCGGDPQVLFQAGFLDPGHARHLALALLPLEQMRISREELLVALRQRNIGATVHYAPLHQMPLFAAHCTISHDLVNTTRVSPRLLTLPMSASMSLEDVDYVCDHFEEILFS